MTSQSILRMCVDNLGPTLSSNTASPLQFQPQLAEFVADSATLRSKYKQTWLTRWIAVSMRSSLILAPIDLATTVAKVADVNPVMTTLAMVLESPFATIHETLIANGSMTDSKRTVILENPSCPGRPFDTYPDNRRAPAPRRRRESPDQESKGAKLRVDNIHYDLTEEDLDELFRRIGPVVRLQLRYDRAGRSEGTAYVTYELKEDAQEAVKQFDGANANGQPIRLTLLPSRNPFDTAVMPGRPLAERISSPGERRSHSPHRRYDDDDAARRGIDRYVPGQGPRRSPMPRQGGRGRGQGGRRPGARRDGRDGGRDQEGGRGGRGNPRGKKTQEELDAEMADYFGGGDNQQAAEPADQQNAPTAQTQAPAQTQAQAAADDIDMIE